MDFGVRCPMCSFEASNARLTLCHLRIVHSSDPNFNVLCGIGDHSDLSRLHLSHSP
jgi:hypothetical protein